MKRHSFLLASSTAFFAALFAILMGGCGSGAEGALPLANSDGRFDLRASVLMGSVSEASTTWLSAYLGREDLGEDDVPDRIFDMREGWQVSVPSQFEFEFAPSITARFLQTAVMPKLGRGGDAHCEVFWQETGGRPQSIASTRTKGGTGWATLNAPLPKSAGRLICITRRLDARPIDPQQKIGWSLPLVAEAGQTVGELLPDVLLLSVDTLRSDALEHMPLLSARFAQGALWRQAISPANWTLPSYASLLSALPTTKHGAGREPFAAEAGGVNEKAYRAIRGDVPLLSEAFRRAGYFTSLVYQNPFLEKWTGLHRGFHRSMRIRDRIHLTIDASREIWAQTTDRPRFLMAQFIAPHHPYAPIGVEGLPDDPLAGLDFQEFISRDSTPDERAEFFALEPSEQEAVRTLYYAECRVLDKKLDRWLTDISKGPRPVLLAFHSDHGEELWDEGSFEHGHTFADCVVRVPMGLLWLGADNHSAPQGMASATQSRKETFAPLDSHSAVPVWALGPTILNLAEVAPPVDAFATSATVSNWSMNLFQPGSLPSELPCTGTLYRARRGGRIWGADGKSIDLPFLNVGASGPPADLGEDGAQFLEQLGY